MGVRQNDGIQLHLKQRVEIMNVYGYTRLNDHRSIPEGLKLEEQSAHIKECASSQDLEVKKILKDIEPTSASLELPRMKKLIKLIEEDKVDVLIVARLDRLTRMIRLYDKLLNLFDEHNVRFISVAEGMDSKKKSGKRVLEAMRYVASWDMKAIPDRTREMIERKREKGERVGHAPFGFVYRNKKLVPVEKELKIADLIREKREDEELSYHKIAKFLNSQRLKSKRGGRWYAETVKGICGNPLYARKQETPVQMAS